MLGWQSSAAWLSCTDGRDVMSAADNFQRRATQEGRQVQEIAEKVLRAAGFSELRPNEVLHELGVTVNFIARDRAARPWYFDVSGAFTSTRAGLIRTDTMWKTLGRANVLHNSGVERLVLLTTNLPKPKSVGHRALTAASSTYFDAIEMLTTEGRARLTLYAGGVAERPLPGLQPLDRLYSSVKTRQSRAGLQVRVPVLEVASALPERATFNVDVLPHRLKVFMPSKNARGESIPRRIRDAAGEKIRGLLANFAGGCTILPGVGSWVDPIGGEMFENVVLIEAYAQNAFPGRLLDEVVSVLIGGLGQRTAALIVNDSMVHVSPA